MTTTTDRCATTRAARYAALDAYIAARTALRRKIREAQLNPQTARLGDELDMLLDALSDSVSACADAVSDHVADLCGAR